MNIANFTPSLLYPNLTLVALGLSSEPWSFIGKKYLLIIRTYVILDIYGDGKVNHYNMTVWILAQNDINFSMAAGLIRLYMSGVK